MSEVKCFPGNEHSEMHPLSRVQQSDSIWHQQSKCFFGKERGEVLSRTSEAKCFFFHEYNKVPSPGTTLQVPTCWLSGGFDPLTQSLNH